MREPDHIAACFLGDVGEVTVHNPGEFVSILPRLASCSEPLSVLFIFPLFSFSEGSTGLLSYHSPAWLTTSRRIHLSRGPGR